MGNILLIRDNASDTNAKYSFIGFIAEKVN